MGVTPRAWQGAFASVEVRANALAFVAEGVVPAAMASTATWAPRASRSRDTCSGWNGARAQRGTNGLGGAVIDRLRSRHLVLEG